VYAEKSYYEMRRINNENWLADHPRSTPEQAAQIDQSRLPRRLTSSELDPTWGQIRWPVVLQRPEFDKYRAELDDIFAHRSEEASGVGSAMYDHVQKFARDMRSALDKEHDTMTQMEWIHSMRFIESLAYEPRFAPGVVIGMNTR
jgi:GNAT superfamily N-acetyltransferase